MKRQFENSNTIFRPRLMGKTRLRLLSVGALLLTASMVQGANTRLGVPVPGTAILLPPFIPVQAPQPFLQATSPFAIIGFIQSATLDTPCTKAACADFLVGGFVEVNGHKIRVPRNTIFQMPATSMSWADLFRNAPAAYQAANQSGLAMSDVPKPLTTYEINVQGNRVINPSTGRDEYVAGLIFMAQQSVNAGAGFINAFDYSKCTPNVPCMPDIWVGQTLQAKTGSRIRINTPGGRYGAPDPLADARFTADEGNPTITTRTGYPMCIPRFDPATGNDSLCPQWNRIKDPFTGAFATNYTMKAATAGAPDANGITHQVGFPAPAVRPDPFEQTPFEIGDNICFSGNLIQDAPCVPGAPASSCQYISAHTVSAQLGIYTAPGTWPVYVQMGAVSMGTGGVVNPIFAQEAVEKIFGDHFTTDFTQLVDVYSEDMNSTTGALSHRFYGSADPFGPPLGGIQGRARFRSFVGNFLPPSRNIAIASRSLTGGAPIDTVLPTARFAANGLQAGFYSAPTFTFIFPENLILGSQQIALPFETFPFLVNGSGPYIPFQAATPVSVGNIGQLSPWPNINAPTPVANSTGSALIQPPVANAGPPQTVPSGSLVTISAAGSSDPNTPAMPLIYTWQQLSGPAVIMNNTNDTIPTQTFTAPTLAPGAAPVVIRIELAVCNGFTCGGAVTVPITVVSATGAPSVTLTSSVAGVLKTVNIAKGSVVTLNAATTCGAGACATPVVFKQIGTPVGVPLQTLTGAGATRTFTATLPVGAATPAQLTFTATQTSGATTSVATISVFIGPDTLTVTNVTYALTKSVLLVSVNSNALPKGAATITVTPMVNNKAIGANVVCFYDPTLDTYTMPESTVNPLPDSVRIVSSYGASIVSPILTIVH